MRSAERYLRAYNVDDYRKWTGDWELLSGIPIAMTPSPFRPHQQTAFKMARLLANAIDASGCNAYVLPKTDWIVSSHSVVRPDISIVCDRVPDEHIIAAPALVVEVLSPSTKERDLTVKKSLYASSGVGQYLTIDSASGAIHHASEGQPFNLIEEPILGVSICGDCEISVDLSSFRVNH